MARTSSEAAAAALEALGFTALESRIYVELLRGGPLTGYRIAQLVGKAAANTYKALDALAERGVVACEDGATRLYRATPYAEVAAAIAGDFSRRARAATGALAALDGGRPDDRVYRLTGADQVYERARALAGAAKSRLAVDAFPDALETLAPVLARAVKRGVTVTVHAYAPFRLKGAYVAEAPNGAQVRARWPGDWLNVCADGSSALIAHVLGDGTVGVWTENAHVAWTFHCGVSAETALAALAELAVRQPAAPLAKALRHVAAIVSTDVPGRSALVRTMSKKGTSK